MKGLLGRLNSRLWAARDARPVLSASDWVGAGLDYQRNRDAGAAETAFREALRADPTSFDATLRLGALYQQTGRSTEAVIHLERAIALRDDDLGAHANLAVAYQAVGRWNDAERAIRRPLALRPDWDGAHNLLGVILQRIGNRKGSRSAFVRAIELNDGNAEALNNLANLHLADGELQSAEDLYRRAIAAQPQLTSARSNLGRVLQMSGRCDEARACFEDVLRFHPDDADALNSLGLVHRETGNLDAAESSFRAAMAIDSRLIAAHNNLAALLLDTLRIDEAEHCCSEALKLAPDDPDIANVLALIGKARGDSMGSETICREALARHPEHARLQLTLGSLLMARSEHDGAERCFTTAMRLDPSSPGARYNAANLALLRGNYDEGFRLYESRFEAFRAQSASTRHATALLGTLPRWNGGPLAGAHVAVWPEQGYGDAIMMLRYLPRLEAVGAARVTVLADAALKRVCERMPGVEVVSTVKDLLACNADLHCPIMSLPYAMRTTAACIPAPCPIALSDAERAAWQARFSDDTRARVGIAWAGSPLLADASSRDISRDVLRPLFGRSGIRWVSLQKSDGSGAASTSEDAVEDWMHDCRDFLDTANLIGCLDLVISVDTAVAHLAATQGVETWLLNRVAGDWRWGSCGERTPWYPSMRIFRQAKAGDWESTVSEVDTALAVRFHH